MKNLVDSNKSLAVSVWRESTCVFCQQIKEVLMAPYLSVPPQYQNNGTYIPPQQPICFDCCSAGVKLLKSYIIPNQSQP